MSLINLFSKPLNFCNPENGSEQPPTLSDKSCLSENLVPNVTFIAKHKAEGLTSHDCGNPTMLVNDACNKNQTVNNYRSKKKKGKKRPRYADYDGLVSAECDVSINWINRESDNVHTQCMNLEGNSGHSNRTLICYEDETSSFKSRNKRRKEKKKMFKALKGGSQHNKIQKKIPNNCNIEGKVGRSTGLKNNACSEQNNIAGFSDASTKVGKALSDNSYFNNFNNNSLKRKAEDIEERNVKKNVFKSYDPLRISELKQINKKLDKKSKKPLSNSKLRKLEKSQKYMKRQKEKQAREAEHQQFVQKRTVPCKFYINGCCNKGDECIFGHDIPQERKDEPCKFYIISQCTKGGACLYRHGEWPCKFFHTLRGCKNNDCRFSHEHLTETSEKWLKKVLEEDEAAARREKENAEQTQEPERNYKNPIENFYGDNPSCTKTKLVEKTVLEQSDINIELGHESHSPKSLHSETSLLINHNPRTCNSVENFYGIDARLHSDAFNDHPYGRLRLVKVDVPGSNVSLHKHFEEAIKLCRLKKSNCDEDSSPDGNVPSSEVDHIESSSCCHDSVMTPPPLESLGHKTVLSPLGHSNCNQHLTSTLPQETTFRLFATPLPFLPTATNSSEDSSTTSTLKLFSTPLSFKSELTAPNSSNGSIPVNGPAAIHKTISFLAHKNASQHRLTPSLTRKYL